MLGAPVKRLAAWALGTADHRSLIRAVGAFSVVRLSGGLLLFLSQILLAGWMGPDEFGIYSYAWAWVAVLSTLAGLGLGATSVRFLAMYRVQHAEPRIRGLLGFGRAKTLGSALVVTLCGLVVATIVARNSPYLSSLQIAFLAIPVLALLGLESAYARGFNWTTFSAIGEQIGRPAVLIVLGWLWVTITGETTARAFVFACVLAYLVATLAQHGVLRRRVEAVVGGGPAERDESVWLRVSAAMLLLSGAQMIRMNTDLILVGMLLEPADVGIYTAAVRVATLVSFILTVTSVVAQPNMASMHAQDRRAELEHFLATATRSIFLASLVIGAGLGACGQWVLGAFGAGFVSGYPALLILLASHVLVAASGPVTSLLTMTGQQNAAAAVHGMSMVSNALLNVLLIPRFGIAGAALATGLNLLLTQLALLTVARRRLGISIDILGIRGRTRNP